MTDLGRTRHAVVDEHFGDGSAFLAAWQRWRDDPQQGERLFYLALADVAPAATMLAPELRQACALLMPGLQRFFFDGGRVVLDVLVGASVGAVTPPARRNPGDAPAGRTAPDRGAKALDRRAIVIGAGLAGAAACERLAARGWSLTLIEQQEGPAQQASGNLAGIFMPLLAQDDNPAARLSRAALLFALRRWEDLGGFGGALTGARCGVLQLARDAGHAEAQRRIAVTQGQRWPAGYARWLDSVQTSTLLGAAAPHGGWWFGQGGWAHPASVCAAMLAACGDKLTRRFAQAVPQIRRVGDAWQALGADGRVIAEAPTLILANGSGATRIAQAAHLPLTAVRGQVTHLAEGVLPAPATPLVLCREAYMTPAANGIVSVGATYDIDADPALRADSQQQNLARLTDMLGVPMPDPAPPLAGRTGFRCVAPDRLPLVGALPDDSISVRTGGGAIERLRDVGRHPGLYGLLGYASRGLIWAPLMAELLAAQLEGEPAPLEAGLVAALDPARFLLKRLRRL